MVLVCGALFVAAPGIALAADGAGGANSKKDACQPMVAAGKTVDAIECYRQRLKSDPGDAYAHNALGTLLVEQKKYPAALEQFNAVLAKNPNDGVAMNAKAMVLMAMQKPEEALALLGKAIQIDPENIQALDNLARINFQTGHADVAKPLWENVLSIDPKDASAHVGMGEIFAAKKDYDRALKHFEEATRIDDKNARAFWLEGQILAHAGRSKEAIPYLERASFLAPRDPDVWYDLGLARMNIGEMRLAGQALTQTMRFAPEDPAAYIQLGKVHLEMRHYEKAAAHFDEARKLHPTREQQAEIAYHYGIVHEQQGDKQHAEEEYRLALSKKPGYVAAMVNLAALYLTENRQSDATPLLRSAVELAPDNLTAQFNLGQLLLKTGDAEGGRSHLQVVIKALPKGDPLREQAEGLLTSGATKERH